MPSPLAHAALGWLVYRTWPSRWLAFDNETQIPPLAAGLGIVGLSLLPDLDAVPGILLGNLGKYHNQWMATPASGLLAALVVGAGVRLVRGAGFTRWFGVALACYWLHVLADYFTVGRGVMVLWPLSDERFRPPFELFYGLRWSHGAFSAKHLVTAATEGAFAVAAIGFAEWLTRRRDRRR